MCDVLLSVLKRWRRTLRFCELALGTQPRGLSVRGLQMAHPLIIASEQYVAGLAFAENADVREEIAKNMRSISDQQALNAAYDGTYFQLLPWSSCLGLMSLQSGHSASSTPEDILGAGGKSCLPETARGTEVAILEALNVPRSVGL